MADSIATKRPADAQTSVIIGPPAIINESRFADGAESDIAPAAGSPPRRAITRRSVFMGIAVPALTGAAVTSSAAGGFLVEPDPIFAVIERHREAIEDYSRACTHHEQLEKEFQAQQDPRGIYLFDLEDKDTGAIEAVYANTAYSICQNAEYVDCDRQAWKDEKFDELLHWKGFDDSAVKASQQAESEAFRRLVTATAGLDTRPTTLAGLAALLRTIVDTYDGDDDAGAWDGVFWEHDENGDTIGDPIIDNSGLLIRIIQTLANAAQSMPA